MTLRAAANHIGKPSIMVRKFLNAQDGDQSPDTFSPKFYFFYGSLMDPGQLARVLGLRQYQAVTRPASITGYSCKMWGPYPALVATRLAEYETEAYEEHDCIIRFVDGEEASGMTFVWRGDADDQDLREGNFNLREWQSEH
ncbi:hypothetical protein PILCRDRAFT_14928 [Piloderma croceum F 1598]|uniref:Gamma-glutamylcyclotransferase AIG2-like domain-containing protein n=1 Tax=Piloderma croceum (strain F 1598) TaxID=765440 RepID=A0A0C3F119_PILCF|nr:hypothetical protein PILCRDRAFT_14928 [Piloderma croceum F 1598]